MEPTPEEIVKMEDDLCAAAGAYTTAARKAKHANGGPIFQRACDNRARRLSDAFTAKLAQLAKAYEEVDA